MDHGTVQRLTVGGILVGVLLAAWMLIGALQRQQTDVRCDQQTATCRVGR
jgi:hypothetical protein